MAIISTVLVTGGSGAIGRAICCQFGRAGWRVAVQYRENSAAADRTCRLVKDLGGEAMAVQADIRDADAVLHMLDRITQWGGLHAMIASAGVAPSGLLLRLSPQAWADTIETNLTGTFHCIQEAGRVMLQQRSGSVVVIGSFAALHGQAGQAAYATSKAGLIGLVKTAAREWGSSNVRINMVLPGWHQTALTASTFADLACPEDHVLGRTPNLDGVAQTVYSLALIPDASGQIWNLDSRVL